MRIVSLLFTESISLLLGRPWPKLLLLSIIGSAGRFAMGPRGRRCDAPWVALVASPKSLYGCATQGPFASCRGHAAFHRRDRRAESNPPPFLARGRCLAWNARKGSGGRITRAHRLFEPISLDHEDFPARCARARHPAGALAGAQMLLPIYVCHVVCQPRGKPARKAIQRGLNPPRRQWGARCFRTSIRFRHRCRMRFASSHRARLGISGRGKGGSRLMPCPLRSSWEGCLQFVNRRKGLAPSERDRGISLAQQNLMRASP